VIHRDINLNNLLITRASPLSKASTTPGQDRALKGVVLDFGVAKVLPEFPGKSLLSTLFGRGGEVGVPAFVSPEQARDSYRATHQSDIYSLGVVLYALLLRRPLPHNLFETFQRKQLAYLSVRRAGHCIPRDLDTIVARATARDLSQRYKTAKEFADDLTNWRDGRRIRATRFGPVEKVSSLYGRDDVTARMLSLLALCLVIIALGLGIVAIREVSRYAEARLQQRKTRAHAALADGDAHLQLNRPAAIKSYAAALDEVSGLEGDDADYLKALSAERTAVGLVAEGRTAEAIPHMQQAVDLFTAMTNRSVDERLDQKRLINDISRTRTRLGEAMIWLSNARQDAELREQGLSLLAKTAKDLQNDKQLLAHEPLREGCGNIIALLMDNGQHDAALGLCQAALAAKPGPLGAEEASKLRVLAMIQIRMGNFAAARATVDRLKLLRSENVLLLGLPGANIHGWIGQLQFLIAEQTNDQKLMVQAKTEIRLGDGCPDCAYTESCILAAEAAADPIDRERLMKMASDRLLDALVECRRARMDGEVDIEAIRADKRHKAVLRRPDAAKILKELDEMKALQDKWPRVPPPAVVRVVSVLPLRPSEGPTAPLPRGVAIFP
jgi:hypothetical protein